MKRLFSLFFAAILMLSVTVNVPAADIPISARAYILYCPENGEALLSREPDEPLPMASTTKIMTTLITLERAAEDNSVVEFTDEMTAEGSSMYLKPGERLTLDDLAVGMMMQSGNDAANAAAISIAGSVEAFAKLMNDKAAELGMKNTSFVTPSGLDDDGHYSTARDMALLMAYAMKNERFAAIASQTSMTVDFIEPAGKHASYTNHNKLLRMYEPCVGGKTGYTDKSGRCLVTAAEKDGMTLIAVTLNDHNDWDDHISLYEWGFDNFTAVDPQADISRDIAVVGGVSDFVSLNTAGSPRLILPKEKARDIETEIHLPAFVYAPVRAGDTAGKIIYKSHGESIGEETLSFAGDIAYDNQRRSIIAYIKDLLNWHR